MRTQYAIFLETIKGDMDHAERLYQEAAFSGLPIHLKNYASFLRNVRQNESLAQRVDAAVAQADGVALLVAGQLQVDVVVFCCVFVIIIILIIIGLLALTYALSRWATACARATRCKRCASSHATQIDQVGVNDRLDDDDDDDDDDDSDDDDDDDDDSDDDNVAWSDVV